MTSCFDVRHHCFNVTRSLNLVTLRLGVKKLPHKSSRFAAFHVAREEPRGVYLPKGGDFRVIDDISLVLNVRRLRISQFHLRPTPLPPPGLLRGICPPCQSRGWGIDKFCTARGPGICQPLGHSRAFDTHAVFYQNITTQRVLLQKKQNGSSVKDRNKL